MGNDAIRRLQKCNRDYSNEPPVRGHYNVHAKEVRASFVAYWNGRKWEHPALKYNVHITRWEEWIQ